MYLYFKYFIFINIILHKHENAINSIQENLVRVLGTRKIHKISIISK